MSDETFNTEAWKKMQDTYASYFTARNCTDYDSMDVVLHNLEKDINFAEFGTKYGYDFIVRRSDKAIMWAKDNTTKLLAMRIRLVMTDIWRDKKGPPHYPSDYDENLNVSI